MAKSQDSDGTEPVEPEAPPLDMAAALVEAARVILSAYAERLRQDDKQPDK